jgi:hypothetical protein
MNMWRAIQLISPVLTPWLSSLEYSPSSQNYSRLSGKEISCLLSKSKVHYHVNKNSAFDRILSQKDPTSISTTYCIMINNNILPYTIISA